MKRWLLFAAFTAALPVIALACGDDATGGGVTPDGGKPNPTATTTTTNTTPTGTVTPPPPPPPPPPDTGPDAATKRTGCLDRPTSGQRPDKLPCELIPPGLTL